MMQIFSFDWKAMYNHFGTLMNGDPIVCGGYNGTDDDVKCFKHEKTSKIWKRVWTNQKL